VPHGNVSTKSEVVVMTPFYAQVDVMLDVVGMCQSIKEFFLL